MARDQAIDLQGWKDRLWAQAKDAPEAYGAVFPAPPAPVSQDQLRAVGFILNRPLELTGSLIGSCDLAVSLSGNLQHCAFTFSGPDWEGALLWVDGEAVDVPRARDGAPLCSTFGAHWADDRFLALEYGGLWDHPQYRPVAFADRGGLRGLLIWDARHHCIHLERPGPEESWTLPRLRIVDGLWKIYPDANALAGDRPARSLPVSD